MSEIVDILMGPDPFYLLLSNVTSQPFLYGDGKALAYTDAQYAMNQMLEYLQMSGYDVIPFLVNDNKPQVMQDMAVSGVKAISLNECDDGKIPLLDGIEAFTSIPKQDGFLSLEDPLVNIELCKLMNAFYQELAARRINKHLTDALFEKLRTSVYLVPVNLEQCKVDVTFPYLEGTTAIPLFTDYRLCGDWLAMNNKTMEEWGTWALSWDDLKTLMDRYPGTTFYLNPNTVDMHVSPELMDGLNSLIAQFSVVDDEDPSNNEENHAPLLRNGNAIPAGKETASVDDWENDDPSKDFFTKET